MAVIAAKLLLTALGAAGPIPEGPAVTLFGWDGEAELVGNTGRGHFKLVAPATWAADAPRDPNRYEVRLSGADGPASTTSLPREEGPGARRMTFFIPVEMVRDRRPDAVLVRVEVVDRVAGRVAGGPILARIGAFPRPEPVAGAAIDPGPFGWGTPLEGPPDRARLLPRAGPDGLRFARVVAAGDRPGVFLSVAEASNRQVAARLPGHDPRRGRSDEFELEGPDQPAIDLTPARALSYLEGLGRADRSGVAYRLPTRAEWLAAARAGSDSAFWWGGEPAFPPGANFLGPEPALAVDSTAVAAPGDRPPRFSANPRGLVHTFGNAAEWASTDSGAFARMGGHFRTEPSSPLPEPEVAAAGDIGEDPYVGVRPALALDAALGAALIERALQPDPALRAIRAAFDPDRAAATLTGRVAEPSSRRDADTRLGALWFLAAVEDRVEAPTLAAGHLAILGRVAGPAVRYRPAGRSAYRIPVDVRWAGSLPVEGSAWYVNVQLPGARTLSHRLIESRPGTSRVLAQVDRGDLPAPRGDGTYSASAFLSLGGEAGDPADAKVVSNAAPLTWTDAE